MDYLGRQEVRVGEYSLTLGDSVRGSRVDVMVPALETERGPHVLKKPKLLTLIC